MSDLPAVSAASETKEPQGPPAPVISEPSAVTAPSGAVDAEALAQLEKRILDGIDERIGRRVDSKVDVRFKSVDRLTELFKEHGDDKAAILRDLTIDEIVEEHQRALGKESAPIEGTVSNDDFDEQYAGILAKNGVSADDADLAQWVESHKFGSRKAFLTGLREEATRMKARREKKEKPVTAASLGVGSEGSPEGEKDGAQLTSEYRQKMLAARGKPAALRAIKTEYAGRGVPVDDVIF